MAAVLARSVSTQPSEHPSSRATSSSARSSPLADARPLMGGRDPNFVDPELRLPFVRVHVVNGGGESHDDACLDGHGEVVARILEEYPGHRPVDRIIEDVGGH